MRQKKTKPKKSSQINTFQEKYVLDNLYCPTLENFEIKTLKVESQALKNNPLRDSHIRYNPVLVPKKIIKKPPALIYVLAGFTGNGPKYFGIKSFEENYPQEIDTLYGDNKAPHAIYVFVDAFSFWGGSQFLNSIAVGNYEDYFVKELHLSILKSFNLKKDAKRTAIVGGSSGGYGALHLCSKYPDNFSVIGAIAPDSDFKTSLLQDLYIASSYLKDKRTFRVLRDAHSQGDILKLRTGHSILNAIGMSACYSPKSKTGEFEFPIDMKTGEILPKVWKKWLDKDPIHFLIKRKAKLSAIKKVYLEVGNRDQYHLYFGARKIAKLLKQNKVSTYYNEFSGTHWDLSSRRKYMLEYLCKVLS